MGSEELLQPTRPRGVELRPGPATVLHHVTGFPTGTAPPAAVLGVGGCA